MTTLNLQVGAGNDDAHESGISTAFNAVAATVDIRANSSGSSRRNGGFRFTNVTIPPGSTISAATISIWPTSASFDDMLADWYADDVDNAADFAASATVTGRTRTTATVLWSADSIGSGAFVSSPDLAAVIQEVIDRAGWASGNALVILAIGRSSATKNANAESYDSTPAHAAKLDITYTAPAGSAAAVRSAYYHLAGGLR